MHVLQNGNHVVFGLLSSAHVDATVGLACRVLAQREPVARALGLSAMELRPYVKACVSAACDEELGVIALERRTERVVGFSLAKEFLTSLQLQVAERMRPMQELSSQLQRWYLRDSSPRRFGVLAHELMTGSAPEHLSLEARREIGPSTLGRELMGLRTALLRGRGFHRSIAVATSTRSQQHHALLGASRLYSIGYREFVSSREQKPFTALSGQSCALMLKDFQREAVRRMPVGPESWRLIITASASSGRIPLQVTLAA